MLAAFITSNARLSSGNWHFGDMNAAIQRIPKHKGDVIDESVKLAKYIQNPQEEAATIRGLMFFNFLGGSGRLPRWWNMTQASPRRYHSSRSTAERRARRNLSQRHESASEGDGKERI